MLLLFKYRARSKLFIKWSHRTVVNYNTKQWNMYNCTLSCLLQHRHSYENWKKRKTPIEIKVGTCLHVHWIQQQYQALLICILLDTRNSFGVIEATHVLWASCLQLNLNSCMYACMYVLYVRSSCKQSVIWKITKLHHVHSLNWYQKPISTSAFQHSFMRYCFLLLNNLKKYNYEWWQIDDLCKKLIIYSNEL